MDLGRNAKTICNARPTHPTSIAEEKIKINKARFKETGGL